MRKESRLRFAEDEVPEAVQPKKKRRRNARTLLFEEEKPQAPSKLVHQDTDVPTGQEEPHTNMTVISDEGTGAGAAPDSVKVRQRETERFAHRQPGKDARAVPAPDSKSGATQDGVKTRQREQVRQAVNPQPGQARETPHRAGALRFEENRPKAPSKLLHSAAVLAQLETDQAVSRENEDGNTGVEAAQAGGETVHTALNIGNQAVRKIREHRRRSFPAAASVNDPVNSAGAAQKKAVRRGYAKAKTAQLMGRENGTASAGMGNFIQKAESRLRNRLARLRRDPKGWALVPALFFMLSLLLNVASSCSLVVQGVSSVLAGSTYPSADADMLAAEAAYRAMEDALQRNLDNYEQEHDYTSYEYDLDEIGHDPYVLISTLTALHGRAWTIDEVRPTLQTLFERQYVLTETEAPDGDGLSVKVELKNNELSHLPVELLSEDQLSAYSLYMSTLGNRPDLFPDSEYVGRYGEDSYLTYDIPPEALEDETFAAMIAEAEKYLGYPYVWGGSSPETSFDCSGFVCWVLNHSGWSLGRTTAQGLCNYCTLVRASDARPGDLVFFKGTYDTEEVSHVGIYVGNSMMIQCGDPITYSNLNSSYWQNHLYCYGRLP